MTVIHIFLYLHLIFIYTTGVSLYLHIFLDFMYRGLLYSLENLYYSARIQNLHTSTYINEMCNVYAVKYYTLHTCTVYMYLVCSMYIHIYIRVDFPCSIPRQQTNSRWITIQNIRLCIYMEYYICVRTCMGVYANK